MPTAHSLTTHAHVGVGSPAPRDAWNSVVRSAPDGPASLEPAWMDSIRANRRWRDASRAYAFGPGRVVVLPLVEWGRGPFRILRSWPEGWGAGGPIAPGGPTESEWEFMIGDLASIRALSIRMLVRGSITTPAASPLRPVARFTQVLSLEGGFDHVRARRFDSGTRRYIRHAERAGLDVTRGSSAEQVEAFATVYATSVARWARTRGQLKVVTRVLRPSRRTTARLRSAIGQLGERCEVWVARAQGHPVAAIVVVHSPGHAAYWLGATDVARSGTTRAPHLLQALAIEDACSRGAIEFDMGESDPGSGVEEWKRRFGAVHRPLTELRRDRIPLGGLVTLAKHLVNRA